MFAEPPEKVTRCVTRGALCETNVLVSPQNHGRRDQRDHIGGEATRAISDASLPSRGAWREARPQLHRARQGGVRPRPHPDGAEREAQDAHHVHVVSICEYSLNVYLSGCVSGKLEITMSWWGNCVVYASQLIQLFPNIFSLGNSLVSCEEAIGLCVGP